MKKLIVIFIICISFVSCKHYESSLNEIVVPYIVQYDAPTDISKFEYNFFGTHYIYTYIFSKSGEYYVSIDIVKGLFGYYQEHKFISIKNQSYYKSMNSILPFTGVTTTIKD